MHDAVKLMVMPKYENINLGNLLVVKANEKDIKIAELANENKNLKEQMNNPTGTQIFQP
jgi:hypothetical protein